MAAQRPEPFVDAPHCNVAHRANQTQIIHEPAGPLALADDGAATETAAAAADKQGVYNLQAHIISSP